MENKRFNNVLLVTIPYKDSYYKPGDMPETGIGYISESIKQAGIGYDILDMTLGQSINDFFEKVRTMLPDLIGFSMKTYRFDETYEFYKKVKQEFPNVPIIVGGPHISIFRETALSDCQAIDFGAVQEGEETMVELCTGKPLNEIKGLIYKEDGKIKYNGDRQINFNLDKIPFPKYEKFELEKYWYPSIYLISSRGCPSKCTFCSLRLVIGEGWRYRSAKNIFEEIQYWYGKGRRIFEFADDNFTLWKERVVELCNLIIESDMKAFFNCPNGVRADRVDKELLDLMKKAGWVAMTFGVEVGTNEMLKDINKGETMEQIEKAIKDSIEAGLEVHLNFIIGFPRQTTADVEKEFELALKYPIRWANFSNLLPYPGTELYTEVIKKNYLIKPMNQYLANVATKAGLGKIAEPVLETPELSREERIRLLKKAKQVQREMMRRYHIRRLKKEYGLTGLIIAKLYSRKIIPISVFNFALDSSKRVKHKLGSKKKSN